MSFATSIIGEAMLSFFGGGVLASNNIICRPNSGLVGEIRCVITIMLCNCNDTIIGTAPTLLETYSGLRSGVGGGY